MSAKLKVDLIVDDKGSAHITNFRNNVNTQFTQATRYVTNFGIAFAAIAGTAAAVGAAMGVAIGKASDLQETTGKFEVVFGKLTPQAEKMVETLRTGFLMSEREAKHFLSSIQDLLVPMGMNVDAAADLSFEVTKLAADLGSFNNLPTAKVMDDIQSALVGNYETMKKYGVVLNATVVVEKALAMGLAETKKELTAANKAFAAYTLIVQGSQAAIGDISRTQMNYANQLKQLDSNVEELLAKMGEYLLPLVTEKLISMNNIIGDFTAGIDGFVSGYMKMNKIVATVTGVDALNFILSKITDMRNEAGHAAKNAKLLKDAFGEDFVVGVDSAAMATQRLTKEVKDQFGYIIEYSEETARQASANLKTMYSESQANDWLAINKEIMANVADEHWTAGAAANDAWNWAFGQHIIPMVKNEFPEQNLMGLQKIKEAHAATSISVKDSWEWAYGQHIIPKIKNEMEPQHLDTLAKMRIEWEATAEEMKGPWTNFIEFVKSKNDDLDLDFQHLGQSFKENINKEIHLMVDDFIWATGNMKTIGEATSTALANSLGSYASKMYDKVFETIIDLIAANVAGGIASSGNVAAGWGGLGAAAAQMLAYGGAATAAIIGARGIANNARAEGGWIGQNPMGGIINGGSGTKDDVFLGFASGANHWGMGGEFVVNKKSTEKYWPLLDKINKGYAGGGGIGMMKPKWEPIADGTNLGLLAAGGHGFYKGGPYGAIAELAAYGAKLVGSTFIGKASAKNINLGFADGGMVGGRQGAPNRGYFLGGVGDWISDQWNSATSWMKDRWDDTRDMVQDVYNNARYSFTAVTQPVYDTVKNAWTTAQVKGGDVVQRVQGYGRDAWEAGESAWESARGSLISVTEWIDGMRNEMADILPQYLHWAIPANPLHWVNLIQDPQEILDQVLKFLRAPVKQFAKDTVEPGKYYTNVEKQFEDVMKAGYEMTEYLTGIDLPNFSQGSNYVRHDGPAYVHQGEQIIPKGKGGGDGMTFNNYGIITTNEVDRWFSERIARVQDRSMGDNFNVSSTINQGLRI